MRASPIAVHEPCVGTLRDLAAPATLVAEPFGSGSVAAPLRCSHYNHINVHYNLSYTTVGSFGLKVDLFGKDLRSLRYGLGAFGQEGWCSSQEGWCSRVQSSPHSRTPTSRSLMAPPLGTRGGGRGARGGPPQRLMTDEGRGWLSTTVAGHSPMQWALGYRPQLPWVRPKRSPQNTSLTALPVKVLGSKSCNHGCRRGQKAPYAAM